METVKLQKEIPIKIETDVFVAGGGPAGVAAAVSAARNGAKVYLIEQGACFGGMGTASCLPLFVTMTDGKNQLAAGICKEVMDAQIEQGCLGSWWDVRIRPEVLKRIYDKMVTEAGVDFCFFTTLCDVKAENGKIQYVICHGKKGFYAVKAKMYIDCTGDGDMAYMAGADYEKGDEKGRMQPGTLCSNWAGIDWTKANEIEHHRLEEAIKDGVFTYPEHTFPGIFHAESFMGNGSFGHAYGMDGTDEKSLTEAIVKMRSIIPEYEYYYKHYLDGYQNMICVATGSLMGVRETRRFVCDYQLSLQDFADRAIFDDEIGRYCYPVDIHALENNEKELAESDRIFNRDFRYKEGESYGIPYRSLTPKGFSNLFVAGRCIWVDHYMLGSVRVMPACMITGEAVGTASVLALKTNDSRKIDISELQKTLKSHGVYLPNYKN